MDTPRHSLGTTKELSPERQSHSALCCGGAAQTAFDGVARHSPPFNHWQFDPGSISLVPRNRDRQCAFGGNPGEGLALKNEHVLTRFSGLANAI
jgi:hypothetical protein